MLGDTITMFQEFLLIKLSVNVSANGRSNSTVISNFVLQNLKPLLNTDIGLI